MVEVSRGGSVSINVSHNRFTAKCGKIKSFLKRPVAKSMLDRINKKLKEDIENLPNFHRYPNDDRQMLNRVSVKSNKANTFTISVNPINNEGYHYGFIIESGREAISGRWIKFQGYYPNMRKLSTLLTRQLEATSRERMFGAHWDGGEPSYYRGALKRKKRELRGKLKVMESNIRQFGTIHSKHAASSSVVIGDANPQKWKERSEKGSWEGDISEEEIEKTIKISTSEALKKKEISKTNAPRQGETVRSELIREIIKKYPTAINAKVLDALNNQQSDLYTVLLPPNTSGVKAAYGGMEPRIMTNMKNWVVDTWKSDVKARIRNYEYTATVEETT